MHDVKHYQVVGKLKDYRRMIHSQPEVRPSKQFNCIIAYVCTHVCAYVHACVYM